MSSSQVQQVWAVDLDFGPSDCLILQRFMCHMTGLTYTANSGLLTDPETREQRFAVISGRAQHSNLSIIHYHVFFQMCKAHLIGYDDKVSCPSFLLFSSLIPRYSTEHVLSHKECEYAGNRLFSYVHELMQKKSFALFIVLLSNILTLYF